MRTISVACTIHVRGIGEPDCLFTPPPETISEYDETNAIETYLSQLLDNPDYDWILDASYLIVPYVIS